MDTQPSHQPRPPKDDNTTFLSPPQADDELGRLGPYRVLKELGRGGMGAVYLAEDTLLKRRVALKVMLPHVAGDAARARFLREARAVAALKHDHVVTVYAAGEENGVPFLAMELLAGKTLDHRCDLFSLGCVLYRMATGRVPFQGDTAYAVIVAVASEEPVPPRAVNPDVPPALEALIVSLLAKEPADRPAGAAAVLAEMEQVSAQFDGTDGLPPDETVEWRPERRGSRRFVVAGVVLAALAAVVLVLVFGRGSEPAKEPDPETAATVPPPQTTKAEPAAAGNPPAPPELRTAVGTWDMIRPNGIKVTLVFTDDGKVTGEGGFRGKWSQAGHIVQYGGIGPGKATPMKGKGDLDPDGKVMRLVGTKGALETWQRRP